MNASTLLSSAKTGRIQSLKKNAASSGSFLHGNRVAVQGPSPATVRTQRDVKVHADNLFGRFVRVVKSYANNIVDNAEDPEKILDQAVNEMQDDLVRLRQETAKYMGSLKQLEAKYNQYQDEAQQWYKRAELALSKGDEELAREALKRKKTAEDVANGYKVQVENIKVSVDQLLANTRAMEAKVAEAKAKKDTLKARAASAKTSKQIQELVQGIDTKSALGAFDRMEQKVLSLEAESQAIAELAAPEQNVMDRFKALEAGSTVDDELSKMKQNMLGGATSAPKTLPEGRPVADAIDMELEALRKKARE